MKTYNVTIHQLFYVQRTMTIQVEAESAEEAINKTEERFIDGAPDSNDPCWSEPHWELQEEWYEATEAQTETPQPDRPSTAQT